MSPWLGMFQSISPMNLRMRHMSKQIFSFQHPTFLFAFRVLKCLRVGTWRKIVVSHQVLHKDEQDAIMYALSVQNSSNVSTFSPLFGTLKKCITCFYCCEVWLKELCIRAKGKEYAVCVYAPFFWKLKYKLNIEGEHIAQWQECIWAWRLANQAIYNLAVDCCTSPTKDSPYKCPVIPHSLWY